MFLYLVGTFSSILRTLVHLYSVHINILHIFVVHLQSCATDDGLLYLHTNFMIPTHKMEALSGHSMKDMLRPGLQHFNCYAASAPSAQM